MAILNRLKNKRIGALIIAAHPDDESIFMGGTIIGFRKWRWSLLCVTDCDELYNKRRRVELERACRIYRSYGTKITPYMLGIRKVKGRISKAEVSNKIAVFLKAQRGIGAVFTHNREGDYGHATHKLVHGVVNRMRLNKRRLFFFVSPLDCIKPHECAERVDLTDKAVSGKRRIIQIYLTGSQKSNLKKLSGMVRGALGSRQEFFIRRVERVDKITL